MKVLVTGVAGFIGFHLARRLIARGDEVVGLDNLNEYYDIELKRGRLRELGIDVDPSAGSAAPGLRFVKMDLEDRTGIRRLFEGERFDRVCHLAAQAGVRYSLTNPEAYTASNISGFLSVLEAAREVPVEHLVYASSSSVYGLETRQPFTEDQAADRPVSLYAASKRSNELMAHSYSHLYGIPATGLRFFTVYGSWYRPDMALYRFADAMTSDRPIQVYNHGDLKRDFTCIDDIVEGILRVLDNAPQGEPPYRIYNIGNGKPVPLMDLIATLERALGIEAKKEMLPMQPGDVASTWADCTALERDFGYRPNTPIDVGIEQFARWYRDYHNV